MRIHDVHDFDAKAASRDLLKFGLTAVDDFGGSLYDCAQDELLEELGHAGDEIDLATDRIETSWGPVFVFRDRARVSLAKARALVMAERKV